MVIKEISILDIGGNGLMLKNAASYINSKYLLKVNKYGIDLDQSVLNIQKENNPDILEAIQANICQKTKFKNQQFDIVFCNDIIEHLEDDMSGIKELSRIAKYVYFKQPLENCVFFKILNILTLGFFYRKLESNLGHINRYSQKKFNLLIESYFLIEKFSFSNSFEYFLRKNCPTFINYNIFTKLAYKIYSLLGVILFKINPAITAYLLSDFYLLIAKSKMKTVNNT